MCFLAHPDPWIPPRTHDRARYLLLGLVSRSISCTHRAAGRQDGTNLFILLQKRENLGRAFLVTQPYDLDPVGVVQVLQAILQPMTISADSQL
jgi:hypothetical protein